MQLNLLQRYKKYYFQQNKTTFFPLFIHYSGLINVTTGSAEGFHFSDPVL